MNWDAIGAIGEIAGALAVVASLVYLALQIRQNTNASQASNELEVSKSSADWTSRATVDSSLRRAWRKLANGEELDEDEGDQILWYFAEWFNLCEGWFQQHKRGLMSEEVMGTRAKGALGLLNHDLVLSWWRSDAFSTSPDFREYIESLIENSEANWSAKASSHFKP